jgi:hypothetical protein
MMKYFINYQCGSGLLILMFLLPDLLWLTPNLALIIQCLSWNNIIFFFNFTYPVNCFRGSQGVRIPQVEDYCFSQPSAGSEMKQTTENVWHCIARTSSRGYKQTRSYGRIARVTGGFVKKTARKMERTQRATCWQLARDSRLCYVTDSRNFANAEIKEMWIYRFTLPYALTSHLEGHCKMCFCGLVATVPG